MKSSTQRRKEKGEQRGKTGAPVAPPQIHRRHLLVLLILAAWTFLAFSNCFQSGFILDNKSLLLDPRIRQATPANVTLIFGHTYWWPIGEAGLYRPFTTLSYLFNYAVIGGATEPAGYHWVNLLLHIGNVWLAYAVALRLTHRFWPAVFTAALWAVHPLLTESVTNIVGRADLLAAMGVLSGLLLYLKAKDASGWQRMFWLAGLAMATTIGVFSKESAVAILPIIALYELTWFKERRPGWTFVFGCIAALAPIGAMLYARSAVLAASSPAEFPFTDNPIAGAAWWTGRLTAVRTIPDYLLLTIWPAKPSCDYSFNQIPLARGSAADWLACGLVLAIAAVVVLNYSTNRPLFFLAGFAFLNFFPASNLLFSIGTIMADRLFYLPSLALLGCLVLTIYKIAPNPKVAAVFLCVVGLGFALRTSVRNRDWRDKLAIATADVRVSPNSFKIHQLLASALFESDPSHSNIDQVIAEQQKSVAILDSLPPDRNWAEPFRMAGYYDLVKCQSRGPVDPKRYQDAIRALRRAISIEEAHHRDDDSQAYLLLSVAYLESGDAEKALAPANHASMLDPLNLQIYRQLSNVFITQDRRTEAEAARRLEDAMASIDQGKWQEAADLTEPLVNIKPTSYPAAFYFNAIANLQLGNVDVAEDRARQAVRSDGARNPRAEYVLALILARRQQFRESADWFKAFLNHLPAAPEAVMARQQLRDMEQLDGQNRQTGARPLFQR